MAQAKYITVAEWDEAYDSRVMGQLSSDTGTAATVDENNGPLLNCIERASAEVESFALRGGMYTATMLSDLQTADDWTLKGLVVQRATVHLHRIRPGQMPPEIEDMDRLSMRTLEDLSKGTRIFNDSTVIAAGKPSIDIIPAATRKLLRMPSDEPFFPQRRTSAV